MNQTSYDCNNNLAKHPTWGASEFDLSQEKEKRIFAELEIFKEQVLNQKILHPFDALQEIDHLYLHYIKGEGRSLARSFIFDQENSFKIFNYLLNLSRLYLAKNRAVVSERRLRHNWIFLLAMSLPLISKSVPYDPQEFNKKITAFLKYGH